jgi:hypothetical protein
MRNGVNLSWALLSLPVVSATRSFNTVFVRLPPNHVSDPQQACFVWAAEIASVQDR